MTDLPGVPREPHERPPHPAPKRVQRIAALDRQLMEAIKALPMKQRERVLLIVIELQLLAQESTRGALLGEIAP